MFPFSEKILGKDWLKGEEATPMYRLQLFFLKNHNSKRVKCLNYLERTLSVGWQFTRRVSSRQWPHARLKNIKKRRGNLNYGISVKH